jgi:uncharacterized protein
MSLIVLYDKVKSFEAAQTQAIRAESQCQKGCSRCCYVDLSVFELEANNIRAWFRTLPSGQQNELIEKWNPPANQTENFFGKIVSACPFLSNESCTIYEARPLICRTQGLPMKFKSECVVVLDVCPLNEKMLNEVTDSEVLNLDLLNQILSQLELVDAKSVARKRVNLKELREEFKTSAK